MTKLIWAVMLLVMLTAAYLHADYLGGSGVIIGSCSAASTTTAQSLCWDTTKHLWVYWSGSAWVETGVVPSGYDIVATSGACPMGYAEDTSVQGFYLVGKTATGTIAGTLGAAMTGTTLPNSSYTPTGTNTATATTGNCATTNIAQGTSTANACKAVAPNLVVPAEAFTGAANATMRSTVAPAIQVMLCKKS